MPEVQAVDKRLSLQFQGTRHTLLTSAVHLLTHKQIQYLLLRRAILGKDTGYCEVPGCGYQLKDIAHLETA